MSTRCGLESNGMSDWQTKLQKLWARVSDRVLDFQPYIRTLEIDGGPIRFFYATAQAASWYDPLSAKNRRELEWLVANIAFVGEKIIDAGAYHGLYTAVFAKAAGDHGHVVAVDPVPSNQAVIEVNLAINGLLARIEGCVISNTDGAISFSHQSCGHIVARGGIRVPSRRLSSIMPEATVVKLDIEGAEFEVVPEQIDDLADAQVWIVEIHPGRGRDPDLVLDAFRTRPFDLWWGEPTTGQIKPYRAQPWKTRTTLIAIRQN
jgi:FkbM family methyltransferase